MHKALRYISIVLVFVILFCCVALSNEEPLRVLADENDSRKNTDCINMYRVDFGFYSEFAPFCVDIPNGVKELTVSALLSSDTGDKSRYEKVSLNSKRKASGSWSFKNIPEGAAVDVSITGFFSNSNTECALGLTFDGEFLVGKNREKFNDVGEKNSDTTNYGYIKVTTEYTHKAKIICFNVNGGEGSPDNIILNIGDKYGKLPQVSRKGYVFDGWYTDRTGGKKVTENTVVSEQDVTELYARWVSSRVCYEISLDADGGAVSENRHSVVAGEVYGELPIPTREGYTFDGWYVAPDYRNKVSADSVVEKIADLRCKWKPNKYVVFLSAKENGGRTSEDYITVTYDRTYAKAPSSLPEAQKEDEAFIGWYTEPFGGERIDASTKVTIAGNHTLYARFIDKITSINYIRNSAISVFIGKTFDLSASVETEPAHPLSLGVSYSSSKPSVATVDSDGVVSAVSVGSTTITICANDGYGAETTVTVNVIGSVSNISDADLEKNVVDKKDCLVLKNSTDKKYHIRQTDEKYSKVINKSGCCASGYAMGLSIMYGKQHDLTKYADSKTGYTSYKDGHIGGTVTGSESYLYLKLYDNLCKGLPAMIHCKFNETKQHWVLVVGIREGADKDNLKKSDFVVLDSATGTMRFMDKAHGFKTSNSTIDRVRLFFW